MHDDRTGHRSRPTGLLATALALLVAVAAAVGTAGSAAAAPARAGASHHALRAHSLSEQSESSAFLSALFNPAGSPPGTNNWNCKPSAAHPYPVVLVHGTFASMIDSFGSISPDLVNKGYCVYAFDYGQTLPFTPFYGMGDIASSASSLSSFVNKVLASTGASKVDLLGHSQGGMMPRYYIDDLGGSSKVNVFVALAPSNHGTNLDGVVTLIADFGLEGLAVALLAPTCSACVEQLSGSSFLNSLNAGGGTVASVKYVVIETKYDEVVTPYTSAWLSGSNVQDILLQNQCSQDKSDHLSIIYDSNALQDVENAFGADSPTFQPTCASVGPLLGDN